MIQLTINKGYINDILLTKGPSVHPLLCLCEILIEWRYSHNLTPKKWCTRLTATSDKVYQGTLASSTTKTGRHDIAEILLKVALNTIQ